MKKFLFFLLTITLFLPIFVSAQDFDTNFADKKDIFTKGMVIEVVDEGKKDGPEGSELWQKVRVEILDGEEKGKVVEIDNGLAFFITENQLVKEGEKVVVVKSFQIDGNVYYITEKYRLNYIFLIFILFVALSIVFAGRKGLMSVVGLSVSIFVLVMFIVPMIAQGGNPILVSFFGSLIIGVLALYLSHGFNKKTSIALLSTIITITISVGIASFFVYMTRLFGTGSEEAHFLKSSFNSSINLQGLLLGGIIIGVLGVLDDVTTTQTATVYELKKANPNLSKKEVYKRAMAVGKEHIISLVNTLALAYAGASMPLLVVFTLNKDIPIWISLNSEMLAEEVVRTLVGSSTLILAIPLTTFLAVHFFSKTKSIDENTDKVYNKKTYN